MQITLWAIIGRYDMCDVCVNLFTTETEARKLFEETRAYFLDEIEGEDPGSYTLDTEHLWIDGKAEVELEQFEINLTILSEARAVIGDLLQQIEQMKGLFSDADGNIQASIDGAEEFLSCTK